MTTISPKKQFLCIRAGIINTSFCPLTPRELNLKTLLISKHLGYLSGRCFKIKVYAIQILMHIYVQHYLE